MLFPPLNRYSILRNGANKHPLLCKTFSCHNTARSSQTRVNNKTTKQQNNLPVVGPCSVLSCQASMMMVNVPCNQKNTKGLKFSFFRMSKILKNLFWLIQDQRRDLPARRTGRGTWWGCRTWPAGWRSPPSCCRRSALGWRSRRSYSARRPWWWPGSGSDRLGRRSGTRTSTCFQSGRPRNSSHRNWHRSHSQIFLNPIQKSL